MFTQYTSTAVFIFFAVFRSRRDDKGKSGSGGGGSYQDKVAQILSSGKSQEEIQKELEQEMQKRREKVRTY